MNHSPIFISIKNTIKKTFMPFFNKSGQNNKRVIITTSWDDGHVLDLKLARLLSKYKIPATLYIPLHSSKQKIISDTKIRSLSKSFEIGCHTDNHINLTQVSARKAEEEILNGKAGLEKILNHKITMFSYPFGSYNKEITFIVKDIGLSGARTTNLFTTKFVRNKFEIGTTVHASNHSFFSYFKQVTPGNILLFLTLLRKKTLNDWGRMSTESLKYVIGHGGTWHLWGHSWEIEKNDEWKKLEEVFKAIKEIKNANSNVLMFPNSKLISVKD